MTVRAALVVILFAGLTPAVNGQAQLLELEGQEAGAKLGFAVGSVGDVDGDGRAEFVVGEPLSSPNGPSSGRAVVHSGADYSPLHTLEGTAGDQLGYGVAGVGDVDGDLVPDFIVGSPLESSVGRARVFSGLDASLIHEVIGVTNGGMFGAFVDGAGDVDGDGLADFVVSAPIEGAVRIYHGSDGTLLRALTGLDGNAVNGMRLEAHDGGDMDGDTIPDLIVGEAFYSNGRGRTLVYSGADGSLLHSWVGDEQLSALYGYSVDGPGDVTGDGVPDVLIGISHKIVGSFAAGEVQIRSGADGSLALSMFGPNQSGTLGRAVAAVGDVNGDGVGDWIAGAPYYDNGVGETLLVSGLTGTVLYQFHGDESDPGMPLMGYSLAGGGDVNGDGLADLLLGSPGEDTDAGNLRVFAGNDLFLIPDRASLSEGETLSFTLTGGFPGELAGVFVTHVNGNLDVQLLEVGTLDANGELAVSVVAPAGTSGTSFTFLALALKPTGFADSLSKVVSVL